MPMLLRHTSESHIRSPGSSQLLCSTRSSVVLCQCRKDLEIAGCVSERQDGTLFYVSK